MNAAFGPLSIAAGAVVGIYAILHNLIDRLPR